MPHNELQPFIAAAKQRGAADEFLSALLLRRGWPSRDVYDALAQWWETETGLPVPAPRATGENSRDAFLYLLAFSTLATWACALGSLWFLLIDRWFPDAVVNSTVYNFRSTATWQMASILVALPIYLFVMRLILREAAQNPDRAHSGVSKWLTYIALLVTAGGLVSDLVCFVDYFLAGELTTRFVLKCVAVLVICGSIFVFYLGALRGKAPKSLFAALALAAGAATLCFGLASAGTPTAQRHIEADARRVRDLRFIAGSVSSMQRLPQSLTELAAAGPGIQTTDPETRKAYEYAAKTPTQYELCANFAAVSDAPDHYANNFWLHGRGHACYSFELGRPAPW
jgi:Domain of unknown function (DUF5671)